MEIIIYILHLVKQRLLSKVVKRQEVIPTSFPLEMTYTISRLTFIELSKREFLKGLITLAT